VIRETREYFVDFRPDCIEHADFAALDLGTLRGLLRRGLARGAQGSLLQVPSLPPEARQWSCRLVGAKTWAPSPRSLDRGLLLHVEVPNPLGSNGLTRQDRNGPRA
jgi:hypothetical protein